jgi:ankyrin repeat protein
MLHLQVLLESRHWIRKMLAFFLCSAMAHMAFAGPLHDATREGDLAEAKRLIEIGADICAMDVSGKTPLHTAAFYGHITIAEILIERGADVNSREDSFMSSTPLHNAALKGHLAVVDLLIEKGAEVDAKDQLGQTPLHLASVVGPSVTGHFEVAKLLITKGANIDARSSGGNTSLHLAVQADDAPVAEALIRGAPKSIARMNTESRRYIGPPH